MKNLFYCLLIVGLTSCSGEPEVVHLRTIKGKKEVAKKIDANILFTINIEGMSCEMGCGGSIRKELKATGGVARVEFDFIEGRKIQKATISYDDKKISENEILSILTNMNESQFKVQKVSSETIDESTETAIEAPEGDSDRSVDISQSTCILNPFDVFKNVFQ